MVEYLVAAGPAGVRDLLAQPRRAALPNGAWTPTARRSSSRWTRRGPSAAQTRPRLRAVLGRHPRLHGRRRTCATPGELDRLASLFLGVTMLDQERAAAPYRRWPTSTPPGGGRGVGGTRLPGRPGARRGVRLAASDRPDLELLGQQLPAWQEAAAVRHPLLERRHDADGGRRCTATSSNCHMGGALAKPGAATHARLAGRPSAGRRGRLHAGRGSPTTSARGSRATGPPSCSAATAGSCCQRAGTSRRWSTRPPTPRPASWSPTEPLAARPADGWAARGRHRRGQLVAGLLVVAGRAERGRQEGPRRARRRRIHGALNPPPAATCLTGDRVSEPMPTNLRGGQARQTMRTIVVDSQGARLRDGRGRLRPARRPTSRPRPCCLSTASARAWSCCSRSSTQLSPGVEVVRFDVPGVGGSPLPRRPYRFRPGRLLAGADRAGPRPGRRARHLVGRRAGPAVRGFQNPRRRRLVVSSARRPAR